MTNHNGEFAFWYFAGYERIIKKKIETLRDQKRKYALTILLIIDIHVDVISEIGDVIHLPMIDVDSTELLR